jgi:hypothetical protein
VSDVAHGPLVINSDVLFAGIPAHVDTGPAFEDGIMSLSLGSQVSVCL